MKFNTRSNTIKAKFLLIRIPFILVLTVLVLRMFEVINNPQILIGFAILFALTTASTIVFRLHHIEAEISDQVVDIKYYHIFPLIREYRHIEIKIENISKAKMESRMGGLIKVMLLSVKTEKGIAIYPEIPITLLTKGEQAVLVSTLKSMI